MASHAPVEITRPARVQGTVAAARIDAQALGLLRYPGCMREVVGIALIAVIGVSASVATWYWRNTPAIRRLLPAVVFTAVGADLLIAAYLWWFEVGKCGSRGDVVCVVNANQGFLTLLALAIAGAGIWVTMLTEQTRRRLARGREFVLLGDALVAACEETYHNLTHIALAYEGESIRALPTGLSLECTFALMEPACRSNLHPRLFARIDPLRRNLNRLREIQERVSDASWPLARRHAKQFVETEPAPLRGFVTTSLWFLFDCWVFYSDICEVPLSQPALRQLATYVEAGERSRYVVFRTSELKSQEASVRNSDGPILCWFDDCPIGVVTVAVGPRFADDAIDHRH
jgi:hypothetical protein